MERMTRRDILKLGAVGAAAGLAAGKGAADVQKKIPVAVQLYSVRAETDIAVVLAAVGKMGYDGVEFAGYWGKTAAELKKLLDDNGLKCCGTHTGWGSVQGDELKKTAEFNLTMGNPNLVVPGGIPVNDTAQSWIDCGKLFSEIAVKAKALGCRVGYHNHSHEFKPLDGGKNGWELFFDNASPDVIMQVDTGNCMGGGGDPVKYLRQYPGRAITIHMKEFGGNNALVGNGEVKWKDVFDACETVGGTQWYIIEQEGSRPDMTPLDCIRKCRENLKKMGR